MGCQILNLRLARFTRGKLSLASFCVMLEECMQPFFSFPFKIKIKLQTKPISAFSRANILCMVGSHWIFTKTYFTFWHLSSASYFTKAEAEVNQNLLHVQSQIFLSSSNLHYIFWPFIIDYAQILTQIQTKPFGT